MAQDIGEPVEEQYAPGEEQYDPDIPIFMALAETFPKCKGCTDTLVFNTNKKVQECLNKYMQEVAIRNFQYPELAKDQGVKGRIFVQFIIERDGSISNAQIVRGIRGKYEDGTEAHVGARQLEDEAIRVVKLFEIIEPATQLGKPVRVKFIFPITASMG